VSTALAQLMRDYWWIMALYALGGLVLGYAARDFQLWLRSTRRKQAVQTEDAEVTRIRGAWTNEPEEARRVINPQYHATVAIAREELAKIRLALRAQHTLAVTTGSIPKIVADLPVEPTVVNSSYLGSHDGSVGRHRAVEVVDVKPVSLPSWARPAIPVVPLPLPAGRSLNPQWREMQPA